MLGIKGIFNLIGQIWTWIKNPDDQPLTLSSREKLGLMFQLLIIDFIIVLPFMGMIHWIHLNVLRLEDPLIDWNPLLVIPLMTIAIPVLEEVIFRFPLKFERNYIFRGLDYFLSGKIEDRWDHYFKYFLYFMILAFGFVHLTNYYNTQLIFFLLSPILIGSQLLGAVLISYARVKLGFIWSTLQHILFNTILLGFGLLFFHNQEIIDISLDNGHVSVHELMFINKEESYYRSEVRSERIYSIDANDVSLYSLLDSLNMTYALPYDDAWVDVSIKSEEGISKREFMKILREEIRFMGN